MIFIEKDRIETKWKTNLMRFRQDDEFSFPLESHFQGKWDYFSSSGRINDRYRWWSLMRHIIDIKKKKDTKILWRNSSLLFSFPSSTNSNERQTNPVSSSVLFLIEFDLIRDTRWKNVDIYHRIDSQSRINDDVYLSIEFVFLNIGIRKIISGKWRRWISFAYGIVCQWQLFTIFFWDLKKVVTSMSISR